MLLGRKTGRRRDGVLVVTFERATGHGVDVGASHEELMAVALDLERRGRLALSERVRMLALGAAASSIVVVRDVDVPAFVEAVDMVGRSIELGDDWGRVRDL